MNSIEIEESIVKSLNMHQGLRQYLFLIASIDIENLIDFFND